MQGEGEGRRQAGGPKYISTNLLSWGWKSSRVASTFARLRLYAQA